MEWVAMYLYVAGVMLMVGIVTEVRGTGAWPLKTWMLVIAWPAAAVLCACIATVSMVTGIPVRKLAAPFSFLRSKH